MIQVGFLAAAKTARTTEERSAWTWISSQKSIKPGRLTFEEIGNKPSRLKSHDVLWWHFDESVDLPAVARTQEVKEAVQGYLRSGGSLLLSLIAAQYVVDLGLESSGPNVIRKDEWDQDSWIKDYPDLRGFGSNQGHPVFEGLAGAVFTWNPSRGMPFAGAFYTAPSKPSEGTIIAVERQYIRLNEDWRMMTEYESGKGRVVSIGSYVFFANPRARFRLHLEKLTRNSLEYLANPRASKEPKTSWQFGPRTVSATTHSTPRVRTVSGTLGKQQTPIALSREPEEIADSFFDVSGRRILIMGKEQSGIQEIWCHPFRLLRNLRSGIKIGSNDFQWFDQSRPRVTTKPESITRVFSVGEARIEETIVGAEREPGGMVHYHVDSNHTLEFLVTASIDLRLMWPHSENATGSIMWAWDEGLGAFVIRNESGTLVSIIGASRQPEAYRAGQFASLEFSSEGLQGNPTDLVQVHIGMHFRIEGPSNDFSIAFAGSNLGEQDAQKSYVRLLASPEKILTEQVGSLSALFQQCTTIESPDPMFNDGYKWALVGTNRFLTETPPLGASLMAGFGTTERGWDGGQKISGRPGYAWYFGRDACWTAFAMLDYGDYEKVKEVLRFLGRFQDLNGKILHEMTTSGHVHYDAADSTPLYIVLVGRYVRASGDAGFVREEFERLEKAIDFCFSTDTDKDHLIENTNVGHGWVEGGKLFPVHTEFYLAACWAAALEEAAYVAHALRKPAQAKEWQSESDLVRRKIRKEFWNEETSFYNFAKRSDGSYNTEKTILPAVATYFGCTDAKKDASCLDAYAGSRFTTDWGVRIVGSDNPMFNPEGYHSGSVWPLFTGWAALAEFASLRPLQGYMHALGTMMIYRHWAAGFIEEVLNGSVFKPGGVCSHQAWSESMILQPLLEGMLGLKSDAAGMRLSFRPWFPTHWDHAEVRSIRVGRAKVDCLMTRNAQRTVYSFMSDTQETIAIEFQPLLPLGTHVEGIEMGTKRTSLGKVVNSYADSPLVQVKLKNNVTVEIIHKVGVGVVPPIALPKPGDDSKGVRIISESMKNDVYSLDVEGLTGEEYSVEIVDRAGRIRNVEGAELNGNNAVIAFPRGSSTKKSIHVHLRTT